MAWLRRQDPFYRCGTQAGPFSWHEVWTFLGVTSENSFTDLTDHPTDFSLLDSNTQNWQTRAFKVNRNKSNISALLVCLLFTGNSSNSNGLLLNISHKMSGVWQEEEYNVKSHVTPATTTLKAPNIFFSNETSCANKFTLICKCLYPLPLNIGWLVLSRGFAFKRGSLFVKPN